jgi:hypothetical protein
MVTWSILTKCDIEDNAAIIDSDNTIESDSDHDDAPLTVTIYPDLSRIATTLE